MTEHKMTDLEKLAAIEEAQNEMHKVMAKLRDNGFQYFMFTSDGSGLAAFGWPCIGCTLDTLMQLIAMKWPDMNFPHHDHNTSETRH